MSVKSDKVLNSCPICGGTLEFYSLMQYSDVYKVKQNGKISTHRLRKEDNGSLECGFFSCTNKECDFVTDCDFICIKHNIKIWEKNEKFFYDDFSE